MSRTILPFTVDLAPGTPVSRQVVFAVERAVVTGELRPGDAFPSVRALSQALAINPNTAHKIVASLRQRGLLVVHPGIGTVVADDASPQPVAAPDVLDPRLERLVVAARRAGVDLDQLERRLATVWQRLAPGAGTRTPRHDHEEQADE